MNIWYLEPNELFEAREIRFGVCPICNKEVLELKEKRKIDGKFFTSRVTNGKIQPVINRERNNIIYRSEDLTNLPPIPFGWVYGVNIETKDKVKQYACDWFNNKKLLQTKTS